MIPKTNRGIILLIVLIFLLCSMAYAEMYLTVARIVTQFDMSLFETTAQDLEMHHVRVVAYPKEGLGDVKVRITPRA